MDEKRKMTRVEFHIKGTIRADGRKVSGEVSDLSLKGLFLQLEEPTEHFTLNDEVSIMINLSDPSSDIHIQADGKIVRIEEKGLGVHLEHMDLDSFTHLKNIISYNIGDHEKVMDEFVDTMVENS